MLARQQKKLLIKKNAPRTNQLKKQKINMSSFIFLVCKLSSLSQKKTKSSLFCLDFPRVARVFPHSFFFIWLFTYSFETRPCVVALWVPVERLSSGGGSESRCIRTSYHPI